ncbi:MAG: alpha/beta hydrolase [Eubacteriales bacterium]|nr:alpha/beta hydrolase [Eubacteriales bacterium]
MSGRKNRAWRAAATLLELTGCAAIGGLAGAANFFFQFSLKPKKKDESKDTDPSESEYLAGCRWMNEHVMRRDVYTTSDSGLRLHGNLIPAAHPDCHRYAVCVHGYGERAASMGMYAKVYSENWGMNVLLPDLRGHGASEGNYIGMGYPDHFDLIRWIDYILEKDPQAVILLHGVSMGAATVLMTTGETLPSQVRAAVSDCAYTSAVEEFTKVYKGLDGAFVPAPLMLQMVRAICLVRARFDLAKAAPIRYVRRSETPTLFIHGAEDDFVPASMMPRLFEAAACPKEFLWVPGAAHAASAVVDPEAYWNKVERFLDRISPWILHDNIASEEGQEM